MATLDWVELGDKYYRTIENYKMAWEQDLGIEHFYKCAAKYGGPIARMMIPDQVIFGIPETNQMFRSYLTIHDSAGKLLGKVKWDFGKKLVDMGWTTDEILVLVYETGELELLNIYGEKVAFPNNLIDNPGEQQVKDCEVFENMLIFLVKERNNRYAFYYIRNLSTSQKPDLIERIPVKPTCFKTIPERHSSSGNLEIFAGHPDGGLMVIMEQKVRRFTMIPFSGEEIATVIGIALTANTAGSSNVFLALLLEIGDVIVLQSNLSDQIGRYSTFNDGPPKQLVWCGSDAVCLAFDDHIQILGPNNMMVQKEINTLKEGVLCVSEIDGLRVITTEKIDFWEKVADSVQETLTIGSLSAPAMLVEAYDTYTQNSTSSGDSIRSLQSQDNLLEAVNQCIKAAQAEFDIENQEKFLKAAAFGKTFLPPNTFDAKELVQTVKHLRVLNDVRKPEVARPLTYGQLEELRRGGELLIKRLTESHQHYLALQIAKYWGLRQDEIYVNWACKKLSDTTIEDREMCDLIISQLKSCRTVNYTSIAQKAVEQGREELAISLLDYEPAVSRKVPLLLYMNKYTLALDRAIESYDPDLIYLVIMKIHEKERLDRNESDYRPGESVLDQVLSKPVACNLLLSYARQLDEDLLNKAFTDLRKPQEAGHYSVQKAYSFKDLKHRLDQLKKAKEYYARYNTDNLFGNAIKEQLELIEQQKLLARETGDRSLVDFSVVNTIYTLMRNDNHDKAQQLVRKFGITEKKLMHIRLRVLADQNRWDEIETMTAGKKAPPITYLPFAETAIKHGEYDRAERFILKHNDPLAQISLLIFIEKFRSAVDIAIRSKNHHMLDEIIAKAQDPEIQAYIDHQMAPKR